MLIKLLLLLSIVQSILTENVGWINHLTNCITLNLKVSQVIFLTAGHEQNLDSKNEAVIRTISNRLSTRKIYFSIDDFHDQIAVLKFTEDPRSSLFVIISSQGDQELSQLYGPITFVSNLSPSRSRPKCLILLSEMVEYDSYEKVLRFMWSNDFLDATILTLSTPRSEQNYFLLNHLQYQVRIHHFNPHNDTINVENYSPRIQWFPDKVRDLHGYKLKVAFRDNPPFVIVKRDESEHEFITGVGMTKMKALSKSMNFKMIIKNFKKWGFLDCNNKSNSTGIYHSLISKKVELLATEFGRFPECDDTFYEWTRATVENDICLVVPVLPIESYFLTASWKIMNLFAVICLPLIIWIFTRLVHFDIRNWKLTYLLQIVLGSSVPREPQRLAERVIFVFLLITCLLYSSVIFTAFTDIGFEKKKSLELETIKDVISSSIKTLISWNMFSLLHYNNSPEIHQNLVEKAVKVKIFHTPCMRQLTLNKNVTCAVFVSEAEYYLQNKRDKCGLAVAKILSNECLSKTVSGTVLTARSPYVNRVDVILLRLIEAGVTQKWNSLFITKSTEVSTSDVSCINKKEESRQVLRQVFFVLIFGYSSSILTFFVELFLVWRLKYRARNFRLAHHLARR